MPVAIESNGGEVEELGGNVLLCGYGVNGSLVVTVISRRCKAL